LLFIEDTGVSIQEAMKAFYNSEVFDRLTDAETSLYSPRGGYVYDLCKIEKEHGPWYRWRWRYR
jgi:hypothetical protein